MLGIYDLNLLIKDSITKNFPDNIVIVAEISSYKAYENVIYITLKDISASNNSTINGCIWKNSCDINYSIIKNGAKVKIGCKLGVFIKNGTYQLTISSMEIDNDLDQDSELCKMKCYYENLGYFNIDTKKNIICANNICIITAKTGAALQDILHVFNSSNYKGSVTIMDALVQGDNCVQSILASLIVADNKGYDLILITRGGGSKEDLYYFNDKLLVEKVHFANTPIITAIGHEIDTSLLDYVSDLKISTPTRAAEIISKIYIENNSLKKYDIQIEKIRELITKKIRNVNHKLDILKAKIKTPEEIWNARYRLWFRILSSLRSDIISSINDEKNKLDILKNKISIPTAKLYPHIIIFCDTDNTFILSKAEYKNKIDKGYKLSLFFRDGNISL